MVVGKTSSLVDTEEIEFLESPGYSTVALAANNEIGKVVAVRKCDDKSIDRNIYWVEFYNTLNLPSMFLEYRVPFLDITVETAIWLGQNVLLGCNDGNVYLLNPFKVVQQSFPLCSSSVIAAATLSSSQAVVASAHGELKFIELDLEGQIVVKKTTVLNSDQKIISLATCSKLPLLAVGLINAVLFINIETNKQNQVHIQAQAHKNTVVWSVLFVDDLLFAGDSRGKVTIFNVCTFAAVKIIQTHEADLLTLCTDGENVFASGVDHRIQVLKGTAASNVRSDWNTVGQRIIHSNDVTSMAAVGDWLISGGAQHEILVSNRRFQVFYPKGKNQVSFDKQNKYFLFDSLTSLQLWQKPLDFTSTQEYGNIHVFTDKENGPKKVLEYVPPKNAVIYNAVISPDAKNLAVHCDQGLLVYSMKHQKESFKLERVLRVEPSNLGQITSLTSSKDALFLARNNVELLKVDFKKLELETIASTEGRSNISKLTTSENGRFLAAATTRCELFLVDLTASEDLDEMMVKLKCKDVVSDVIFCEVKKSVSLLALVSSNEVKLKLFDLEDSHSPSVITLTSKFDEHNSEVAVGLSQYADDSVIISGSHGTLIVAEGISHPEKLRVLFVSNDSSNKEISDIKDPRKSLPLKVPVDDEVHWGTSVAKGTRRSAVICKHKKTQPPSRAPFKIKRYGRV